MTAQDTREARGLDCLSTIAGSKDAGQGIADFFETRGALGSLTHLTAAGEIWARTQISRRDRSVIVISSLTAMARDMQHSSSLPSVSQSPSRMQHESKASDGVVAERRKPCARGLWPSASPGGSRQSIVISVTCYRGLLCRAPLA